MTLAEILSGLYGTPGDIRRLLDESGIPSARLDLQGSALNSWNAILKEARDIQLMWALIKIPLTEYAKNPDLLAAWESELSSRRREIVGARNDNGDTLQTLMLDLIWNISAKQDKQAESLSSLHNDTHARLNAVEKWVQFHEKLIAGQGADIDAIKERPENYTTRIVLLIALLAGASGGLFSSWGRMALAAISRWLGVDGP